MNLFNPADRRPLHFMGVGGAGMSALALLACRRGVAVTGCDSDISGALDVAGLGALVCEGHDPAHVGGTRAVVVTAAISPQHPELQRARDLGIPVVARKEALAKLIAGGTTLAVAGTHGKTTTTVMATEALTGAGLAPTGLAGGRVSGWGGNAKVAGDTLFVVEADEYDKAFLALHPTIAIVNNVEADHLECYGSMASLEDAFVEFAGRARVVIVGADDLGARRVAERLGPKALRFGTSRNADIRIDDVVQASHRTTATVRLPGVAPLVLRLKVPGMHNLRNAVGALGAAQQLGADLAAAVSALAQFDGVGRRFERLGEFAGIELIDDYAHHPSELVATLAAARQVFPGRRIVAVFQPHLYSRTAEQGNAMGEALAAADFVIVTEIYAAREQPVAGVSGQQVADAATRLGATTLFEPDRAALVCRVLESVRPGDVVLTLGAGDITRAGPELARRLGVT